MFGGHDGVRRLWALLAELWDGLKAAPRLLRELDGGHVLVVAVLETRSHAEPERRLSGPCTCLWRTEDGKLRSDRMRLPSVEDLQNAGLWPG